MGEHGHVIGIDMTDEQLDVARRHIDAHTVTFGYSKPNVEFRHGYIEDLKSADIADNSVDSANESWTARRSSASLLTAR